MTRDSLTARPGTIANAATMFWCARFVRARIEDLTLERPWTPRRSAALDSAVVMDDIAGDLLRRRRERRGRTS
jgi:hypothetical protein